MRGLLAQVQTETQAVGSDADRLEREVLKIQEEILQTLWEALRPVFKFVSQQFGEPSTSILSISNPPILGVALLVSGGQTLVLDQSGNVRWVHPAGTILSIFDTLDSARATSVPMYLCIRRGMVHMDSFQTLVGSLSWTVNQAKENAEARNATLRRTLESLKGVRATVGSDQPLLPPPGTRYARWKGR